MTDAPTMECSSTGLGGGVILHVLHPIIEFDGHSSYQVLVHDIDHVSYFQDESGTTYTGRPKIR